MGRGAYDFERAGLLDVKLNRSLSRVSVAVTWCMCFARNDVLNNEKLPGTWKMSRYSEIFLMVPGYVYWPIVVHIYMVEDSYIVRLAVLTGLPTHGGNQGWVRSIEPTGQNHIYRLNSSRFQAGTTLAFYFNIFEPRRIRFLSSRNAGKIPRATFRSPVQVPAQKRCFCAFQLVQSLSPTMVC
jgi:hypothetical protein